MSENGSLNDSFERDSLARERTCLAAERTVSAWVRTGLASVGGGFAIVRFLVFQDVSHRLIANWVGEALIIWGICIFMFALSDYRASYKKLGSTRSPWHTWWITATISIFVLVSLLLLFIAFNAEPPSARP